MVPLELLRVVERRAISPRRIYAPAVLRRPLNDLGGAINVGCPAFRPPCRRGRLRVERTHQFCATAGCERFWRKQRVVGRVLEIAGSG